jgi:DNA-directed RNA polymerase subunit N (RpoN/RPB10)
MRKLSELLSDLAILEERYMEIDSKMEEGEEKEDILTDLGLAMDCIGACLMYGDYINDTGKPYNYFED